ncbi:MAG TPA: hypothetical protein VE959_02305 [Bryobacteraceae bacterium]|nr:hypothetical protein [Bryobacteraceae bacterium]
MLVYPQLGSGALSQFPVVRRRKLRTVVNRSLDGRSVKLADPFGAVTEWSLQYAGLSDDEMSAIEQFFAAAEGTLNAFTFLDPASNLLAWSGQLDNAVWQRGPQLTVTGGVADPTGGTGAWHIVNSGEGAQSVTETLAAPGGYVYCFSAYVRAQQAGTVTMLMGSQRADQAVGSDWGRIVFTSSGDPTFGLEAPAGMALDVFGMQVEPQAAASVYQASTTGGVYENARLRDDALTITTTDLNCHSCTVNIIHAEHL